MATNAPTIQLAHEWLERSHEIKRQRETFERIRREIETMDAQLVELSRVLLDTVGANLDTRTFVIGEYVLLVEHKHGIRVLKKEVE